MKNDHSPSPGATEKMSIIGVSALSNIREKIGSFFSRMWFKPDTHRISASSVVMGLGKWSFVELSVRFSKYTKSDQKMPCRISIFFWRHLLIPLTTEKQPVKGVSSLSNIREKNGRIFWHMLLKPDTPEIGKW